MQDAKCKMQNEEIDWNVKRNFEVSMSLLKKKLDTEWRKRFALCIMNSAFKWCTLKTEHWNIIDAILWEGNSKGKLLIIKLIQKGNKYNFVKNFFYESA